MKKWESSPALPLSPVLTVREYMQISVFIFFYLQNKDNPDYQAKKQKNLSVG